MGTIVVALACNACCWLPPLLIAIGGTGSRFAEFLHPYRPVLLALMVIQLAWGFKSAYRSHHVCCGRDDVKARRVRIGVMWGVAILVIGLNLIPHHDAAAPTPPAQSQGY